MTPRTAGLALSSLLLLSLSAPAQELKGRNYSDAKVGYKIKVPKGWEMLPLSADQKWLLAQFRSDKKYFFTQDNQAMSFEPILSVYGFPRAGDAAVTAADAKADKAEAGSTPGEQMKKLAEKLLEHPFRDYEEMLKRVMSGYHIESQKDGKVSRIPVTNYRVDASRTYGGPVIFEATCFHLDDLDIVMEVAMPEEKAKQVSKVVRGTMKSLRPIERDLSLIAAEVAPPKRPLWVRDEEAYQKLAVSERAKQKQQYESEYLAYMKSQAPSGWSVRDSEHFLVISHMDKGFTDKMVSSAEMFVRWCDQTLGGLSDEYVRRRVLRVCKDETEYQSYVMSTGLGRRNFDVDREVVTYRNNSSGTSGKDAGRIYEAILQTYLQDKAPDAYGAMPGWFLFGLSGYVGTAFPKGRDVEFRPGELERDWVRELIREGKAETLQQLIARPDEELFKGKDIRFLFQLSSAVRFLIDEGGKFEQLQDFLPRYIDATVMATEEVLKDPDAVERRKELMRRKPESEAEEEELRKEREEFYKERRAALADALKSVIFDLDPAEWAKVEAAYLKFIQ